MPRVIGLSLAVFCLTTYSILIAIASGYLFAFLQDVPLTLPAYLGQLGDALRLFDTETPVVFHSGLEGESDIRDAMNAGAQAYLVKPIGIDELEGNIERLLEPQPNPSRMDS